MTMEQGIVFDIQRFSLHDGPGIRTTVFLKGCPLRCAWCHNPESWRKEPELWYRNGVEQLCGKAVTVEEVMAEVMADEAYYRNSGGGLTVSGGEPMVQFPFLKALLTIAKARGIHTCLETSGHCSTEKLIEIAPMVDLFLFDIKLTDPEEHRKYTGADNRWILENLDRLYRLGAKLLLRCPIIPGINDTDDHIGGIARLTKNYPGILGVEIMPYHDMGKGKWKELGRPYSLEDAKTLEEEEKSRLLQRFQSAIRCHVTI